MGKGEAAQSGGLGCVGGLAAWWLRSAGFEVVSRSDVVAIPPGKATDSDSAEKNRSSPTAEEKTKEKEEKELLKQDAHTADYLRSFGSGSTRRMSLNTNATTESDSSDTQGNSRNNLNGLRRRASSTKDSVDLKIVLNQKEKDELEAKLLSWECNAFEIAEKTSNRPLEFVVMSLMNRHELLEHFGIPEQVFRTYIRSIERLYDSSNPYHNNTHAADVSQAVGVILGNSLINDSDDDLTKASGIAASLTKIELFAIILGAAIHDVNHPGVTNDFLVNSKADVAFRYNDRSVNENHHISVAFKVAREPEQNVFDFFSPEDFNELRKLIIDMIFATDMAGHGGLVAKFTAAKKDCGVDPANWEGANRSLLLQMALHCADLSNASRPQKIAELWADQVLKEFFRQGDIERDRGMSVSPLCDRHTVKRAASQVGFIKFIVRPTLELFAPVSPRFEQNAMPNLSATLDYWQGQVDAAPPA